MSLTITTMTTEAPVGRNRLWIILLLVLAVIVVYGQIGNHGFILFDDEEYLLNNPRLLLGFSPENLSWFLTSHHASNWHPLTWYSHLLDVTLFGLNPRWHHYGNLLLHSCNAILLYLLLERLTGQHWRSAVVALLFAVHPLNVESVAWAAERKNTLSTLFWLLTLVCYCAYARWRSWGFYLLAIGAFTLGLMAKQMLVTMPLILLLLDYWPLQRTTEDGRQIRLVQLLLEKIPFVLLALMASGLALSSQQGAINTLADTSLAARIANAFLSCVAYLGKYFWPSGLAPFYPFPDQIPAARTVLAALLIVAISVAVIRLRKQFPYLLVGWFWFLLSLLPVIGIVKIGLQAMADRYAYVPAIGIALSTVWLLSDLCARLPRARIIKAGAATLCLVLLAGTAHHQAALWSDTRTLFNHTLKVTEGNYVALNLLGEVEEREGNIAGALERYRQATTMAPWHDIAPTRAGIIQINNGKPEQAAELFSSAIHSNPRAVPARINLGILLSMNGQPDRALALFREAAQLAPGSAAARYNLGLALAATGNYNTAISEYRAALQINPLDYHSHNNLGIALAAQGNNMEAVRHFSEALRLKPDFEEAFRNRERLAVIPR